MDCTEESLALSNFNPEHPVIILSHGWNSNGREEARGFGSDFAEYYLSVGEYNVFSVDWGDLESWTNYPHAAAITRPVGEYAACIGRNILLRYQIGMELFSEIFSPMSDPIFINSNINPEMISSSY